MDPDIRSRRTSVRWVGATAVAVLAALGAAGCASALVVGGPLLEPTRARAFVDTFSRILVAGLSQTCLVTEHLVESVAVVFLEPPELEAWSLERERH